MGWHVAVADEFAVELLRRIVADALFQVLGRNVMNVTIDGVQFRVEQLIRNTLEDIVGGEEIVRVESAYHVARRQGDALVHGVVDAFVWFADDAHPTFEAGFVLLADGERVVLGTAVLDDELVILESLSQDAF